MIDAFQTRHDLTKAVAATAEQKLAGAQQYKVGDRVTIKNWPELSGVWTVTDVDNNIAYGPVVTLAQGSRAARMTTQRLVKAK
jgi:hypothetical protein